MRWIAYCQYQLMRKKIVLQVGKLMQRPQRKVGSGSPVDPAPLKKHSFEQMYKQAKKHQNRNKSRNTSSYSHNCQSAQSSIQSLYQSLKASRNTPKNTYRPHQEYVKQRLNRSLEAKKSSIDKNSPVKRNHSIENKGFFNQKTQQQAINNKGEKKEPEAVQDQQSEWQSQEQFQCQWKTVIAGLDHQQHQHLRQTECFLSLEEIFLILRSMHYLRKVEDEKYLLKIWKQLDGETYGGVPSNNLHQLLAAINYCPSNLRYPQEKGVPRRRAVINADLKILISDVAKLQIYQEYLTLRINHILYGNSSSPVQYPQVQEIESETKTSKSNNIKIVQQQERVKRKIVLGSSKKSSDKKYKSNLMRQKRSQQITRISEQEEKQHNQDTICYSEFSESKQSGKNLSSNESENRILGSELIEDVVIKRPILSVDVNLGDGMCQKLTVFEGETALEVSRRLVQKYNIDQCLRAKFEMMLGGHIRNLLYRIDEVSEEMFSDREE